MKTWVFAQPEATGSNGWAGKAIVAGLDVTSVDRGMAFYEDDARLIAAAPAMFKEIQETRERLDALLEKLEGKVDEDTLIALATIADGSWPTVHTPSDKGVAK
jgi:hypothetical protein